MDPSSISPAPAPTTVPFAAEPNNHPPAPISEPLPNHPPYAEMIYTAIEALKEKDGSSKTAIAKYIEQVYKETLPPNHSNLLTHHLKRLKNNGMLVMVKKSYTLPRSAPLPGTSQAAPSASQSPRPRGRPRKAQAQAQDLQPQPIQNANNNNNNNAQQQNAEPVWAALGLADDPQAAGTPEENKRGPGRPRKTEAGPGPSVAAAGAMTPAPRRGRGRPPGSKSKKRVGRPPKEKPVAAVSDGPKRRLGRPPKNQPQPTPIPFAAPAPDAAVATELPAPADGGAVPVAEAPRTRGRPRKNNNRAIAVVAAAVAAGRGRGRGGGRGRGRGRGGLTAQANIPTGKPVGRPRKGTTSASSSQNVANEDLRRKLEHFQSKVKESLAVLKPHFNHESPVTAIAAIQELEVLGTMDLKAPLRDETPPQQQQLPQEQLPLQQQLPQQQQQLPQQQLLPQPQMFQQPQYPQFHLLPAPQQYVYHQQQQQPPPPPQ